MTKSKHCRKGKQSQEREFQNTQTDQCEKMQTEMDNSCSGSSTMASLSTSACQQTVNGTPTMAGLFQPPHMQFVSNQQQTPMQSFPYASPSGTGSLTPLNYTALTGASQPGTPQSVLSTPSSIGDNLCVILNKLCVIESSQREMQSKLNKLDRIESDVKSISGKVSLVEAKVATLESRLIEADQKLSDIEASRTFDSSVCDEIKSKHAELMSTVNSLKLVNSSLSENLLDLQSRSMRDNLLFFNIEEEASFDSRKSENCSLKVHKFCNDVLKIENADRDIKIDRAHRIGRYERGKKRPIVAKFNYYGDKVTVKEKAREHLDGTSYRVSDQFPKAIQERRKKLIPYLVDARKNGKQASLSQDILYIDRVKYTCDNLPPGPVPVLPSRGNSNGPREHSDRRESR